MREALEAEGAPADILQCITLPSLAASQEIMRRSDLVIATGGQGLVRAAYSSGTPAYGVGAGNATEFVDETADLQETARNCMLSKTSDFGSGCSADGNVLVPASRYQEMLDALQAEGGYLATSDERAALQAVMWDDEGHRLPDTVAVSPQVLARAAGFDIPSDRRFILVEGDGIAEDKQFCKEKLTTLMAVHKYEGSFEDGVELAKHLYDIGGKGHSCGIASTDDAHIDYFARHMPVSRIMVRQPNSKANAGSFTNGMPMTSSMGCGTWGGNITSENVSLRHYLNTTWVSRTIPEDRPSDEELFGDFYDADARGDGTEPMTEESPQDLLDEARRWWQTDIIDVRPGEIDLRGYPVQELIGNVGFVDTIWLMLRGELPSRAQAALLEAALVASVDHGPQAPSIAIARMAVTCGARINGAMASAINVLDDVHGGPGQQCMELYLEIDAELGETGRRRRCDSSRAASAVATPARSTCPASGTDGIRSTLAPRDCSRSSTPPARRARWADGSRRSAAQSRMPSATESRSASP